MIRGGGGFFVRAGKCFVRSSKRRYFLFRAHSGAKFFLYTCVRAFLPESEPEYFFSSGYGTRFFVCSNTRAENIFLQKIHTPDHLTVAPLLLKFLDL